MEQLLRRNIEAQRARIAELLRDRLEMIVPLCGRMWDDVTQLDTILTISLAHIEGCRLLYALDCDGVQVSSNIAPGAIGESARGQILSVRPYLAGMQHDDTIFQLSPVYISQSTHQPCVTALHKVYSDDGELLGCVAADFGLNDLPNLEQQVMATSPSWRQIRGDPAIRQNLFQQERVVSAMDEQLEPVLDIVTDLLTRRGVFHAKLHFSSSRATLWLYNDPHRYRLHVLDEIIDPNVCLAYPRVQYPADAEIAPEDVPRILNRFADLRRADQTVYLRSSSINTINGLVGLNFSCDGSHYMPAAEFLRKDDAFWFGTGPVCPI